MKVVLTSIVISLMMVPISSLAQADTAMRKGTMHFKSIRIIGNDTLINEQHIDLNEKNRGTNLFFRFGDDFDTLISGYQGFGFDSDIDSLLNRFLGRPFHHGEPLFPGDSTMKDFRFRIPQFGMPGTEPFRYEFREIVPDGYRMPEGLGRGGFFGGRVPGYSVEDVAIYPEKNSVRNFEIRPIPGSNMLMIEADLDNKRSVYTVYDNRGKTIQHEKLRRVEGEFRRVLDLGEMKSGTYFVEIKNGRSTKKKRLTIR